MADTASEAAKRLRESSQSEMSMGESPIHDKKTVSRKPSKKAKKKAKIEKDQTTLESFLDNPDDSQKENDLKMTRIEELMNGFMKDLKLEMQNFVTKEQHQESLKKVTLEFQTQIDNVKLQHRDEIERLEGQILEMEHKNRELDIKVDKLSKESETHAIELDLINRDTRDLFLTINDLEQHGRSNSIRISGVPDDKKNEDVEDTCAVIIKLFKSKLQLDINSEEIDTAHRLGPYKQGKPRNIICKFIHRRCKTKILNAGIKNLPKTGMWIRDDVTKYNQNLLDRAFQCPFIAKARFSNRKIRVITKSGRTEFISTEDELDHLWGSLAQEHAHH